MNEEARKRALRLLEKRDYSRKMLLDKLTEKGVPGDDAAEVADWLCETGLVNDARYAELIVRHYAMKGYGQCRICDELYRRGIARELLGRVVAEARAFGCGAVQITASDMGVLLYTDFGFEKNGNFMQYKL